MGSVYQRTGSPYWYFDVPDLTHPSGRRRKSTKKTNRKEAEKIAATALASGVNAKRPSGWREVTLKEAMDDHLADMRERERASVDDLAGVARKIFGEGPAWSGKTFLNPARKLHVLTEDDLKAYRRGRSAEGYSPGTVGRELALLRAAIRYAEGQGCRPCGVTKWRIQPGRRRQRFLTTEEAKTLLAALDPDAPVHGPNGEEWRPSPRLRQWRRDSRDMVLVFLFGGLRWNELASLAWSQVDLPNRSVIVRGKGNKQREVPLLPAVVEVLERRHADQAGGSLVFPGRGGKKRYGTSEALYAAIERAGLNAPEIVSSVGRMTVHGLRHTFATWARQRGVPLEDLQPLLGHSDIKTTLIYAKILPQTSRERMIGALEQVDLGTCQ